MQAIKPRRWIVLSLSLFFSMTTVYTQRSAYLPLLTQDATWDVGHYSIQSPCKHVEHPRRFFIGSDTVIHGLTYKKMYYYDLLPIDPEGKRCPPYYVDSKKKMSSDFLREDTVTQQIFHISSGWEDEMLVFDCSVSEGDTIIYSPISADTAIVDSIRSLTTSDNITRRVYYLSKIDDEIGFGSFIEGVGGSEGLFNFPLGFGIEGYGIFCMKKNGAFIDGYSCDDVHTQNSQVFTTNIEVYPTQIANHFNIRINEHTKSIKLEIYDATGSLMKSAMLTETESTINVSELAKGFYVIKIYQDKLPVFTQKINKQ